MGFRMRPPLPPPSHDNVRGAAEMAARGGATGAAASSRTGSALEVELELNREKRHKINQTAVRVNY